MMLFISKPETNDNIRKPFAREKLQTWSGSDNHQSPSIEKT